MSTAITCPRLMMKTRSATSLTSGRMCVESRTVCLPLSSAMSSRTSLRCFGSRLDVGSSRISTGGSCTSACARPTRCLKPFDSLAIRLSATSPSRVRSMASVDGRLQAWPAGTSFSAADERAGTGGRSSPGRAAGSRAGSRSGASPRSADRRGRTRRCCTRPSLGGRYPVTIRIVVVLPAPLGPRKPRTSPSCTSNDRLSTATKRPYFFERCERRITTRCIGVYRRWGLGAGASRRGSGFGARIPAFVAQRSEAGVWRTMRASRREPTTNAPEGPGTTSGCPGPHVPPTEPWRCVCPARRAARDMSRRRAPLARRRGTAPPEPVWERRRRTAAASAIFFLKKNAPSRPPTAGEDGAQDEHHEERHDDADDRTWRRRRCCRRICGRCRAGRVGHLSRRWNMALLERARAAGSAATKRPRRRTAPTRPASRPTIAPSPMVMGCGVLDCST